MQTGVRSVASRRRVLRNLLLPIVLFSYINCFFVGTGTKILQLTDGSWIQTIFEIGIFIFIVIPAGSFVLSALLSLLPTKRKT